ncbi:MAG: ArsA family ATPase [Myxococcota bacterium]|jgi:anion-transporting  ArsA/GET3 family ATPase|nr:ArsA family ATPase [Myxococcota bacterium]
MPEPPSHRSLDSHRFVFVTGKGGSGKTTLTAALALALAARGKKVLVATSRAQHRLAELLGTPAFTTEIQPLRKNLWGVYLVPEVALREYGALVLKSQRLVTLLFDNRYAEGLFHGAPGLREWALLGKAWFHTTEKAADGAPRFDVVLFDAPATGHGVDMLRVPKVILSAAPPGRLRTDAERAYSAFQDPSFSAFVVVTLPEELPTNETLELVSVLDRELGLPVAEIVLNSALEPLFSEDEARALASFGKPLGDSPVDEALSIAARRALAERVQAACVERLSQAGKPLRRIPRLAEGAASHEAALELSRHAL